MAYNRFIYLGNVAKLVDSLVSSETGHVSRRAPEPPVNSTGLTETHDEVLEKWGNSVSLLRAAKWTKIASSNLAVPISFYQTDFY